MISAKGKHNFWSHLLLSMIAIFALPTTQGAEHQHNNGENYQSQQVQQEILRAVSLKRQTQIQPNFSFTKIFKIEPFFVPSSFSSHAPIRGSPKDYCL